MERDKDEYTEITYFIAFCHDMDNYQISLKLIHSVEDYEMQRSMVTYFIWKPLDDDDGDDDFYGILKVCNKILCKHAHPVYLK